MLDLLFEDAETGLFVYLTETHEYVIKGKRISEALNKEIGHRVGPDEKPIKVDKGLIERANAEYAKRFG